MIDDTQVDGTVDGEETPVVPVEETTEEAPEEAPATEAGEEEAA